MNNLFQALNEKTRAANRSKVVNVVRTCACGRGSAWGGQRTLGGPLSKQTSPLSAGLELAKDLQLAEMLGIYCIVA